MKQELLPLSVLSEKMQIDENMLLDMLEERGIQLIKENDKVFINYRDMKRLDIKGDKIYFKSSISDMIMDFFYFYDYYLFVLIASIVLVWIVLK